MEIGEGCRQIDAVILPCVVEMGYRITLIVVEDGVDGAVAGVGNGIGGEDESVAAALSGQAISAITTVQRV